MKKKTSNKKRCHYIINMDTVLRTVFTEFPKMIANGEKTRVCYIHSNVYFEDDNKLEPIRIRRGLHENN